MTKPRPLTLGTAGHIDHGKTVLIEALTGTNTDRLPEERARGISIELGFAQLALPSGRTLSVVDVPGHERFVRTMVAGATGIDLFLLVVAADDGVMPQTREHVAVLEMLRVPLGVVAITKSDLVEEEVLALAADDVRGLLSDGPFETSEIVPVSAPTGAGLDLLLAALDRAAALGAVAERGPGAPRLHVDRSFTLRGVGTVVTGTLWAGELRAGDEVVIEPGERTARVRTLEVHGTGRDVAEPGQRVAVNLGGLDRREVHRGDIVSVPDSGLQPAYVVDAAVELARGARPLRRGARVHLHHGTREVPARVAPLEGDAIEPGSRAYAQLRLERPIVPVAGDRFVLRQVAPPDTIAGGTVIDPAPRKHGAGDGHVERLRLLELGDPLDRAEALLAAAPSGLAAGAADPQLLDRLVESGRAHRIDGRRPRYFSPAQYEDARKSMLAALDSAASGAPAGRGELADAAGIAADAAGPLLDELVAAGEAVRRGAGFLARAAAESSDPDADRLVAALHDDFLEPRTVEPLAAALGLDPRRCRETLDRLVATGGLTRAKPGLYYHPAAVEEAKRRIVTICERDGSVTIASLRDELGTSRKYAQALLEYLDSQRVTLRRGDEHVLRGQAGGVADRSPVR